MWISRCDQGGGVCEEKVTKRCKQTGIAVLLFRLCCVALTQVILPQQLNTAPASLLSFRLQPTLHVRAPGGCRTITQRITHENFPAFACVKSRP